MLFDDKRRALRRALAGALLGMAGGGLAAWGIGSLFIGSPSALVLELLNCGFPRGLEGLGIALSFALYALFGAEVGVATLRRGRLRPGGADAGPLRPDGGHRGAVGGAQLRCA